MTKFWELFERSVILQSVITLILISAVTYLYISQQDVPDQLAQFTSLILGFWFGSKVENKKSTDYIAKVVKRNEGGTV